MASQPPPESVLVGQFAGIRNNISRERLAVGDLERAINVDIDDAGQARRRRGRRRVIDGSWHSVTTIVGRTFGVQDDILVEVFPDYSTATLENVGPHPLDFTAVGDTVYFASEISSGRIVGNEVLAWGTIGGDGRWISPVVTPTETLGAISGQLLGAPPMASVIELYRGRIYLAAGRVLWFTEVFNYNLVDRTRNFIVTEHPITMIAAVDDGIYVGTTTQLLFLQGVPSKGLVQTIVSNAPVVPGSCVGVPRSIAHPGARNGPIAEGNVPMFLTGDGICVGLNGGELYNLTRDRVVFPPAVRAAALYREDQGANSYVAVMDSAGGPTANARIGDFVDAEIRRASQGG